MTYPNTYVLIMKQNYKNHKLILKIAISYQIKGSIWKNKYTTMAS